MIFCSSSIHKSQSYQPVNTLRDKNKEAWNMYDENVNDGVQFFLHAYGIALLMAHKVLQTTQLSEFLFSPEIEVKMEGEEKPNMRGLSLKVQ